MKSYAFFLNVAVSIALVGGGVGDLRATPLLTIDTVFVGDAGNTAANSTNASSWGGGYGHGAVGYNYRIGKNLVTNQQYTTFLNAVAAADPYGLYNLSMGSNNRGGISRAGSSGNYTYSVKTNFALKPVNYVNFYSAAMFTNWLSNGATTSSSFITGAYTIKTGRVTVLSRSGNVATLTSPSHTLSVGDEVTVNGTNFSFNARSIVTAVTANTFSFRQDRSDLAATPSSTGSFIGTNTTRNPGANWWVPSENEWVKAAYYDAATGNYSLYATQSNSAPTVATANASGDVINPGVNVANYANGVIWNLFTGNVSTVGSAGATSFFGTYDQSGNVSEWNETVTVDSSFTSYRVRRGGGYKDFQADLRARTRFGLTAFNGRSDLGFRVASVNTYTDFQIWKLKYTGDINAPDDGDDDGDGYTNLQEFILGMNGSIPDRYAFEITRDEVSGNSTIVFPTLENRVYQIYYSSDLEAWLPASHPITGDGSSKTWADDGTEHTPTPSSETDKRFYRIAVSLAS